MFPSYVLVNCNIKPHLRRSAECRRPRRRYKKRYLTASLWKYHPKTETHRRCFGCEKRPALYPSIQSGQKNQDIKIGKLDNRSRYVVRPPGVLPTGLPTDLPTPQGRGQVHGHPYGQVRHLRRSAPPLRYRDIYIFLFEGDRTRGQYTKKHPCFPQVLYNFVFTIIPHKSGKIFSFFYHFALKVLDNTNLVCYN